MTSRKLTDCMGPLSPDNIDAQFCSTWLKDEIRRVFNELTETRAQLDEARKVLAWTASGCEHVDGGPGELCECSTDMMIMACTYLTKYPTLNDKPQAE